MGKTRAEYQKEYRERKKLIDKDYIKRERERTKKYKVPIDALSKESQIEKREKNRLWKKISRERLRIKKNKIQIVQSEIRAPDNSQSTRPLTVKLNFNTKKRQKRSKALRTANKTINALEEKLRSVSKENKKLRKRNERALKKIKSPVFRSSAKSTDEQLPETPNSKTKKDIRNLGLTPKKIPKCVRKKLLMANAMLDEIKVAGEKNKKRKKRRVLANIVSGKIIKKYQCLHTLSKEIGMGRRTLYAAKSKNVSTLMKKRRIVERESVRKTVVSFMERDDVSVIMPGKNDCKKIKQTNEKKQIRVLNDYLSNLYEKFISENADFKISKTVFRRLRPKNILLTKMISRNTCLCTKHQNFAMKIKALRSNGVDISANPETVCKNLSEQEMKEKIASCIDNIEDIKYQEWKRVEVDGKKKMKIVDTLMKKHDFKLHMETQYTDFRQHVSRVKTQYSAIRTLKEQLPHNEMLIHMDFAENFTCSNADEIQSAYWNSTAVSLHPIVVYYKLGEDLEHKNYIYISDVLNHNAFAVYTILKKLVPELKCVSPDLKVIHYWTDSPSSQYRNKYIFDIVLNHQDIFHVAARWNYFESGHGKGPCDGLGGVAKRQAAEACKQGKVNIQDAHDFYHWASDHEKTIKYVFYTEEEYQLSVKDLENRNPRVVQGTMKLHAVFPVGPTLYTASVSCYCKKCIEGSPCDHWQKQDDQVLKSHVACASSVNQKRQHSEMDQNDKSVRERKIAKMSNIKEKESVTNNDMPASGRFALVNWDGAVYPGRLDSIHEKIAEVSFMEESSAKGGVVLFRWPTKPDIQKINIEQIVHMIDEPIACSKSRRQFRLKDDDYNYLGSDSD